MTISKRTRYEVLRRDGYACRYCHATDRPLSMDHVMPRSLGGSDDFENLVSACMECNLGKSDSHPGANSKAEQDAWVAGWHAAHQAVAEVQDGVRPWWCS